MTNRTLGEADNRAEVPPEGRVSLPEKWRWLLALGIVWIVLGAFALVLPFAAAVTLELVLGAIFAVGGIGQVIQAFQWRGWPGFTLHLLGGIAGATLGALLLLYPLHGVLTLTMLLSAFFLVEGAFKIVSALQHRSTRGWQWMLFSGIAGVAVGVLIWAGWPGTAVWALGLLIGLALIFSGWAMAMLAVSARCD